MKNKPPTGVMSPISGTNQYGLPGYGKNDGTSNTNDFVFRNYASRLPEEKRGQLSEMINAESKRLARIIQTFLDVERLAEGQMELKREPFNIGDVIVEDGASIWYGAVVRADFAPVVIRAGANVQDGAVLHGPPGLTTEVGAGATVAQTSSAHGPNASNGATSTRAARRAAEPRSK